MKRYKMITRDYIRKRLQGAICVILVLCMGVQVIASANVDKAQVRTVNVDPIDMSSRFVDVFENSDILYDEELEMVSIMASSQYVKEENFLLDNVSMSETETECIDDAVVNYECSFDMKELVFECNVKVVAEDGTMLAEETIVTDAIITENGGLDACIVIDGEEYMMSDYEKESSIDNCSIQDVLKTIKIYLAVAETAEKVKALSNYKYNKNLEENGNGVGKGYYIYNQSNTTTKNRKAGNYRFGFTTFNKVGCEVAAAYNTALALNDSERLSETIFYFETWAIEFAIGWGHLGSDPLEIYRYLGKRGFKYSMYVNYSSFKSAVAKKGKCCMIMSRWNAPKSNGLHTFFVKKVGTASFNGYNWKYDTTYQNRTSLDSFNNGSGFIVGYIVWK